MTTTTYAADRTALLIVDPYNDFMSEGGKFYEAIRKTAEAVGDGRTWLRQLHHFVTRAACTLWRPACRGAGRGGQWTALAVGMAVALAASPGQAVPAMPAGGFGMPTPVSPVNEAIVAGDLDAAERLSDLGDRYVGQHALADAEAAFRGALAIFEAALGLADPRVADSMTALADVRAERRDFTGAECQRPPYIEPPGSGKLSHPGSPIVSQAGSPILSHPGSAIGSHHPVDRDRIPSSFSPPPEIFWRAHQLQEVTSGGTEESGDRHP